MNIILGLQIFTICGAIVGYFGFFLMRHRLLKELAHGKEREEELARRVYETEVLKEIGERIGYSLDAAKIVQIISGSFDRLLSYSTISYLILSEREEKIDFSCNVHETVAKRFIDDVKTKMMAAFSAMADKQVIEGDVDESISGAILDDNASSAVKSYFNLPLVILGKPVGLINVSSSHDHNLYTEENTSVLYRIAKQASEAVSKLQEVLETEKGKLLQAIQSLSDGLLMVDTRYHLVLVNQKLTELLGIVEKPSLFDIVNALSGHLDLRVKMEEALRRDLPIEAEEVIVKDKVLQIVFSRVLDRENQKPIGIAVLFHDNTDAAAVEKLRHDFTAMMIHELRAPLTSIRSTMELLMEELDKITKDELQKYLSTVDLTSQTMLELVNDLLDVAKLEAGKFDVVCDEGDLTEAVADRIESVKPQAMEKNLKLTLETEEDLPKGYFDKIRIKQVLNNLFSNALKFTDRGEIKVRVAKEVIGERLTDLVVSIKDTGIGIDKEQFEGLFSKFKQLKAGRNKAGLKSSGLGLYIAKGIVEAWGGKIWGESEGSGMGSTFYFTVPLAEMVLKDKDVFLKEDKLAQKVAQA